MAFHSLGSLAPLPSLRLQRRSHGSSKIAPTPLHERRIAINITLANFSPLPPTQPAPNLAGISDRRHRQLDRTRRQVKLARCRSPDRCLRSAGRKSAHDRDRARANRNSVAVPESPNSRRRCLTRRYMKVSRRQTRCRRKRADRAWLRSGRERHQEMTRLIFTVVRLDRHRGDFFTPTVTKAIPLITTNPPAIYEIGTAGLASTLA